MSRIKITFILFLVVLIVSGLSYGLYIQSGAIFDKLPGLQVLLGYEDTTVTTNGQLQIDYTLQDGVTCAGDLLGFRASVVQLNGQFISDYQFAILAISNNDQEVLDSAVDDMVLIVAEIDNIVIPSCVTFMDNLSESHRLFSSSLFAFLDALNTENPQERGELIGVYLAANNTGFLANGFFFGKLDLIVDLVEGIENGRDA